MDFTPNPDRLRALARGELSREERAALERELASEPGLRGFTEDFALVSALTAEERATTQSRTRFEDLEPRLATGTPWKRVAAAAAALLLASGLYFAVRACARADDPLLLTEIELDAPAAASALAPDLPASWSGFDPRGDKGVAFLANLEEARELAAIAQRPLLVYGGFPGCPMCIALDSEVFSDAKVVDLAQLTVPVRVNLALLPEREMSELLARGYPFLELWSGPERTPHALAREPDPEIFAASLLEGLGDAKSARDRRSWSELGALVARYDDARAAERAGSFGAAERGFGALAGASDLPEPLAERARAGLSRLAAEARTALLTARDAGADEHAARSALQRGLERFAGTRWEADLRAVLEWIERTGRFPALAEADTSA